MNRTELLHPKVENEPGLYVIRYSDERPAYVGLSKGLKSRLANHRYGSVTRSKFASYLVGFDEEPYRHEARSIMDEEQFIVDYEYVPMEELKQRERTLIEVEQPLLNRY